MKLPSLCLAATLAMASPALAQDEPKSVPKPTSGSTGEGTGTSGSKIHIGGQVYVDEKTPPFDLPSSRGRQVTPARLRGDWVLLYFSEGRRGFSDLRRAYPEITATGCTVLGLTKSNPQTLRTWAERDSIPFEMLADPTGEISSLYGLYDSEQRSTRPGFVIFDREGIVRMALFGQAIPPAQVADLVRFTDVGF